MTLRAGGDKCHGKSNVISNLRQSDDLSVSIGKESSVVATIDVTAALGEREDRLLREANGIVDAIVFPRLRDRGVPEVDLHSFAMHAVRQVQFGRDHDGSLAELLSIVRSGVNGCRPKTER